jgi:hypothetical protein
MGAATRLFRVIPVQKADAAIPTAHHVGLAIVTVNEGDYVDIEWGDVATPEDALGADIVAASFTLLSGSIRHAAKDDENTDGVVGTEARINAPATVTLTSGWIEQFELIGREPATLAFYAYIPDTGFVEGEVLGEPT